MTQQACQMCAHDDTVIGFLNDDGEQVLYCEDCDYSWTPTQRSKGRSNLVSRSGIGEEWGVYDALIACVDNSDQWLEYGIIEHRYKLAHPSTYAQMVQRWSHTKLGKTRYSASNFLGSCLGHLAREGAISTRRHRITTGYWAYLSAVTHVAGVPEPPADHFLSWHTYATQHALDPNDWVL